MTAFNEIAVALDSLDDHLAFRTYLISHDIMAADWILWGSLKGRNIGDYSRSDLIPSQETSK